MSKQFYFNQFSLVKVHSLVLLRLRAGVDLGVMAVKEWFAFPKNPYYWNLTIRNFSFKTLAGEL